MFKAQHAVGRDTSLRKLLYVVAGIFIFSGFGIFAYKVYLGFPLTPKAAGSVWNVEVRLSFLAHERPVEVSMFIPTSSRRFAIVDEEFVSPGYQVKTLAEGGNRKVTWSVAKAGGEQILYYHAVVRAMRTKAPKREAEKPGIITHRVSDLHLEAANALVSEIKEKSADTSSFVGELMRRLNRPVPEDNIKFLLGHNPSPLRKIDLAALLLGQAEIPARVVRGLNLDADQHFFPRKTSFLDWLQFYDNGYWWSYDSARGKVDVPDNWFPWWRGAQEFVDLEGGTDLRVIVSANPKVEEGISAAVGRGEIRRPLLLDFSLLTLPLNIQAVYRVMLMIPVGALVLVLMRNVVGIKTFGTFMPVLIALAFRETGLVAGILIFTALVAMGLTVRFYLEQLKLLLVPRLCAVLIVVILCMAGLSITLHSLEIRAGLSVALLPMVILTMTIERMSISWEEEGPGNALTMGLGSLLAASLAFIVMNVKYIEHLVFVFPELLLVLLAITLLLGRYSGYRLMDLYRFRSLAEN